MDAVLEGMLLAGLTEEDRAELVCIRENLSPDAAVLIEQAQQEYARDVHFPYRDFCARMEQAEPVPQRYGAWYLLAMGLLPLLREYYRTEGFPEGCFESAMKDFRIKLRECRTRWGCAGWFAPGWFARWFSLDRAGFDRLQFERRESPEDYAPGGIRAGDPVLFVHIPADGPLDMARCEADFRRAADFFAQQFPEPVPFFCHSWMLNPHHPEFLPPTSRILPFQRLFDVTSFQPDPQGRFLWRFFGTDCTDFAALPERNSLERAYKAWLLRGGEIGEAAGFYLYRR